MKTIEVDDELYRYIASHTLHIGESASDILRRMLKFFRRFPTGYTGQQSRADAGASACR
ncbi:replication initiation regulator SeqA [Klebsiella pneumoniae subsp. ozaenae]|uniref:Replication initiation regulator SeqA n=1 Tax=Klebsiella pneumoniae subsp. ozaenae TaxID=574 RepID=A0A378BUU6_KLEPO|nr:replication initiation regulator SeqA [Klebsiella pneumoniae subsp. ozaenae]